MNQLNIREVNGQFVAHSKQVSEVTGIRHDNLISKIKGYVDILATSKLRALDFFIDTTYQDEQGKNRPCYLLTRKGCDMVANKMTGEKGVLFTAEYVTRFEEMEKEIRLPKLSKELQAIFAIDEKQQRIEAEVNDLKDNMPLFNVECKELQTLVRKKGMEVLGGYGSKAYKNNSLRGKVYSDIQHQLKREFGVNRYEAIKRIQLDKAKEIIEAYKVPLILEDEILLNNNQLEVC